MSELRPPREHSIPVSGVFILFLGLLLLLQSFGALPWALWGTLWRFWPVVLIITALGILLRRFNVWLVSGLIFAILVACLGLAIWQYNSGPPPGTASRGHHQPVGGVSPCFYETEVMPMAKDFTPAAYLMQVGHDIWVIRHDT